MDTADQTARAGRRASTTIFLWLYWRDTPPVQSDQMSSILAQIGRQQPPCHSLYRYTLLLYGLAPPDPHSRRCCRPKHP